MTLQLTPDRLSKPNLCRPSILVVASDFPYPADHGGRRDVWNRSLVLSKLATVDLVATVSAQPSEAALQIAHTVYRSIVIVERSRGLANHLDLNAFQVRSRIALKSICFQTEYDHVILEGAYVAPVLDNKSLKFRSIDYRVHNDERRFFLNLAFSSKSIARKCFYLLEAVRIRSAEMKCFKNANRCLFISADEHRNAKDMAGENYFLPAAGPTEAKRPVRRNGGRVLFVGSLFMQNNIFSLKWYLKKVHPLLVNRPGYQLVIAGNARGTTLGMIQSLRQEQGVELILSPERLDTIYETADIFINPAQDAAGVKVKVLDAIWSGLPVVSTPAGAAGTGLVGNVHLSIARRPTEFAEAVNWLLLNPALAKSQAEAATQFLSEKYDTERNLIALYGNQSDR